MRCNIKSVIWFISMFMGLNLTGYNNLGFRKTYFYLNLDDSFFGFPLHSIEDTKRPFLDCPAFLAFPSIDTNPKDGGIFLKRQSLGRSNL